MQTYLSHCLYSTVVSIFPCHGEDPGSIPGGAFMSCEDQPMYYENKFEGEWKFQKKNRYVCYQLISFALVLFALLAITAWLRYNNALDYLAIPLFIVIILNFILLFIDIDVE